MQRNYVSSLSPSSAESSHPHQNVILPYSNVFGFFILQVQLKQNRSTDTKFDQNQTIASYQCCANESKF